MINISLFIKHSNSREITMLLVYVDDIVVIDDESKEREELRKCLI